VTAVDHRCLHTVNASRYSTLDTPKWTLHHWLKHHTALITAIFKVCASKISKQTLQSTLKLAYSSALALAASCYSTLTLHCSACGLSARPIQVPAHAVYHRHWPTYSTVRITRETFYVSHGISRLHHCLEWHMLVTLAYITPVSVVTYTYSAHWPFWCGLDYLNFISSRLIDIQFCTLCRNLVRFGSASLEFMT